MIWLALQLNTEDWSKITIKSHLFVAIKAFWQFSQFYGEYSVTPPEQRNKFCQEYHTKMASKSSRRLKR
ncbi:hypothetical protein IQ230_24835 [Gloeocapsopsis crepidinum LEGE 06123]|uniref:Transposase n=1 Tax=Gloeocapsopsis crepidinum LEGE 06123 TaxID=588587 RepID=A0ABR9UYV9_9CHRO|nr:hypothetical protein [Gloeocapsopsis crepidinum]MBE9193502.1 hypothetical protein [Gloeocapsopsis crepidinum LEGE 06123]